MTFQTTSLLGRTRPSEQASGTEIPASQLLTVKGLAVDFHSGDGSISVVRDVSFSIDRGETLGIVGESGSGKSVTALSLARLLPASATISAGEIIFDGKRILDLPLREVQRVRGRDIGFIFQDPMTSLNPTQTIGQQVAEPARTHLGMSKKASLEHAVELLNRVGIPHPRKRLGDYPHQFSGGMRQRVMIAIAIACNPALLIADEATTALDVTMQAQILELIQSLSAESNTAVMMITHDLAVASSVCDRINVMYSGEIVESSPTAQIFSGPKMPYTSALMRCIATLNDSIDKPFVPIPGLPPDPATSGAGCRFKDRCSFAEEQCEEAPALTIRSVGHSARCWGTEPTGWLSMEGEFA